MNKVMDNTNNKTGTDYIYKSIIIGDANIGKTTINQVYIKSSVLNSYYEPTIGIEFGSKIFKIKTGGEGGGDVCIKLHAWDTAGQEAFKSIVRNYYRDICLVFLVYDITNRKSFANLNYWLNELHRFNPCNHTHFYILIGTKVDLDWKRQVAYDEGWEFAKQHGFEFIEINALNCNGLHLKIYNIIESIYSSNLLEDKCPGIKYLGYTPPKSSIKFETIELGPSSNDHKDRNKDRDGHSPRCCN